MSSAKLTITSDDKNKTINVRVLKVSSIANIKTISRYFLGLLTRLKTQQSAIIEHYKNVGRDLPNPIFKNKGKSPSLSKRLTQLQDMDRPLFTNKYSVMCQKEKQPIGIRGKRAVDEYLSGYLDEQKDKDRFKLKYSYGAKTKDQVMGDNWYVCIPPATSGFRYPYLKNTGEGERPLIPCCRKTDSDDVGFKKPSEQGKVSTSTIMLPDKILKNGVKGKLPLGIKEAWADDNNIYLRLGVQKGPKSFLRCLSLALTQDISIVQQKLVEEIKAFRTQETFGYTPSQLEKIIENKNEYVDPCLFLGIAQNVMNVQIFLYAVTKKYLKGDLARPRTAFAYLTPLETFKHAMVIIIHQNSKPPQCELIIRHGRQKLFEPNDLLVKTCKTILLRSSRVFSVIGPT